VDDTLFFAWMIAIVVLMRNKLLGTFTHYKDIILWDADYYELIHGVGLSAFFMIWGMGISYVVTILSARWFGAEGMGLMAMVNTIIVFAWAIAGLGIQWSVVRYINQRKAQGVAGRIRTLHGYIIRTVLPFSILIALVLYLGREWLANTVFQEPRLAQLIIYLALAFPLIVLGNIGLEMIKGYKDLTTYHSINKIGKILLRLVIITMIRYSSQSLLGPAVGLIIAGAAWSVMMLPRLWRFYKDLPTREAISNSEIIKTSLPMMVTGISAIIMNQTDIVMLGIFTDTSEVGIYQVAFKLAALISFWLMMVNMIIWQKIAQLHYSWKIKKLQSTLKIGAWISTSIWSMLSIVFVIFASQWMWLFWTEFIKGTTLLQILCIGQFINAAAWPAWIYMNMTWRENILRNTILFAAIMNVILNLLFIPYRWIIGAWIASAISFLVWNVYLIRFVKTNDNIKLFLH